MIGEEKQGGFKTYHFDYRGSTVAITDACGNITDTFAYDTYGKCISHSGSSFVIFGYNGRDGVVSDKNGLIYMRARYYSPDMQRFVNADIIHGSISDSTSLNRYSYVNGNPVSFVDPFGLSAERCLNTINDAIKNFFTKISSFIQSLLENARTNALLEPSVLEAAYMAQHIYGATNDQKHKDLGENFGGWTLYDILVDDNGFKMGVYSKTINGKTGYTIVNKGTTTWNDWGDNLAQPFGWSSDMKRSIALSEEFCENHSNAKITFVGHSKGGAEAAANAVATNRDAILFNPATVNLAAYDLDSSDYTSDMTAYIVEGEILNKVFGVVSTPIDEKETLKEDSFWIKLLKSTPIGQIYDLVESFSDHSMETVIESLIDVGYN